MDYCATERSVSGGDLPGREDVSPRLIGPDQSLNLCTWLAGQCIIACYYITKLWVNDLRLIPPVA